MQTPDFQTLFESAPGLFLVLTPSFDIVAVSNAYLQATKTQRADILGKHLFKVFPDNPDDPAADGVRNLKLSLERVVATQAPDAMAVQKYDIRLPDSEGGGFEARYWSPLNCPAFDAGGRLSYIIHRVEDVTEFMKLKQAGAEHMKVAEHLRTRVEESEQEIFRRAQEVNQTNRKLEEANKKLAALYAEAKDLDQIKTDFFANVSHELRTPLTLILGPLQKLLANAETDEAQRKDLDVIERNAQLLLRHVNDLLDVSRLEAGKMSLVYKEFDAASLLRRTVANFESLAAERNVSLSVEAPRELPAEADPDKLNRIVVNLLSNAFKFTPQGGKITARLKRRGSVLTLSVADTGPGIPVAMRRAVFERFQQVDGGAARRAGGTGLGLAIVREFCQLHRGRVKARASKSNGALFTVILPLQAAPGAPVERGTGDDLTEPSVARQNVIALRAERPEHPVTRVPALTGPGGLVLIVEDNPDMLAFLRETVEAEHRVVTATNGAEGIALALQYMPDLVLTDVMMPGMSGDVMAQHLLSRPETSDIPIIVLSAKAEAGLKNALLKKGVSDYIAKPFSPDEVRLKVNQQVARRRKTLAEYAKLVEDLRRTNAELEKFARMTAHDLRTPLLAISYLSSWLEADLGENPPGAAREHLNRLRQRVFSMDALLSEILAQHKPVGI